MMERELIKLPGSQQGRTEIQLVSWQLAHEHERASFVAAERPIIFMSSKVSTSRSKDSLLKETRDKIVICAEDKPT